jgi:hypothetical protein
MRDSWLRGEETATEFICCNMFRRVFLEWLQFMLILSHFPQLRCLTNSSSDWFKFSAWISGGLHLEPFWGITLLKYNVSSSGVKTIPLLWEVLTQDRSWDQLSFMGSLTYCTQTRDIILNMPRPLPHSLQLTIHNYLVRQLITNYMELSPSKGAASISAPQEFPTMLLNMKVHCRVHNSTIHVLILIQIDPVHTSSFYFSEIPSNNVLPFTSVSSKGFSPSGSPT